MHYIITKNWQRVSKPMAKQLYEEGNEVYMLPCNIRPEGMWFQPVLMPMEELSFDKIVNAFRWYNCNKAMGYYPAFYIRVLNN